MDKLLTSKHGPVIAGGVIGILAAMLADLGNPGNMGVCVACFTRDIAGALGLHRAAVVQYIRPEIPGFILGAFVASLIAGEHRPRGGSSPIVRFFLGVFAMIGALIFLGCPWRAYLRLAGGDGSALFGIAGLVVGIIIGVFFLTRGFSLGASKPTAKLSGVVMAAAAIGLLAFLIVAPKFGAEGTGPIFFSESGPGSMHAPLIISAVVGAVVGLIAQRTRFCTIGAIRDLVLLRDAHLFKGVIAFIVCALAANVALGHFNAGFEKQPVAHTDQLWNFLGMMLSGLAFTLAGGCPGRQVIMSGEGDSDAAVFVVGMLVGAAFAHNFGTAASGAGIGGASIPAAIVGIIFCLAVGFGFCEKMD